ncbi:MAG: methyl-accepting chemotaxis protein [Bacteroidales bacterium]|nr:methyl-accepting chemotaxis protein [Bacteroidales bacterium]
MNLFFNNYSIKVKILLFVFSFTTLFFGLIIFFLSFNVKNNSIKDSKEIINTETKRYANLTQNIFDNAFSSAETYTDAFLESRKLPQNVRDTLNKNILLRVLNRNPDYLSVALHYEISALDPNYKKKNGRVRNIAFKLNNESHFSQNIADTNNLDLTGLYYEAREIAVNMVSVPYYDTQTPELAGILMVTIITALVEDGKYIGQTGIDLTLKKVQQMIQTIKPSESSIAYLVASNNSIVAHSDTSLFNKDFIEINKNYEKEFQYAIKKVKENKSYNFEINKAGDELYVSFFPIKAGNDDRYWALVTETPISVFTQKSNRLFYITIFGGIIGILLFSLAIYFAINGITKKLILAINFAQEISDGNLSSRIDITSKDEIGQLAKSMNHMANKLKKMIQKINSSSDNMNNASSQISEYSAELSQLASGQAASAEEVMASIEEISANIHSNSENASQTEKISEHTLFGIKTGSESATETLEAIKEITNKISIINEISKQTNILSLNAAVEAARAGQYGKGFGVVANEVKKLAERSQEAANQINELSEKGINISSLAEKELSILIPDVEKTALLIREISTASNEQGNGIDQIGSAVQILTDIAQKNAAFSVNLDEKAKLLNKEAELLKTVIKFFKI